MQTDLHLRVLHLNDCSCLGLVLVLSSCSCLLVLVLVLVLVLRVVLRVALRVPRVFLSFLALAFSDFLLVLLILLILVLANGRLCREICWTLRCVLGFPLMGLWQAGQCGNDINAAHRSHGRKHVVSSGDDGLVRLFNFPSVIAEAPSRSHKGHSVR